MTNTAIRDSNGNPVFVDNEGNYVEDFPSGQINRQTDSRNTKFIVSGFVGEEQDYEKFTIGFNNEYSAIGYATMIYGRDDIKSFDRDGEVYKVEIKEVSE